MGLFKYIAICLLLISSLVVYGSASYAQETENKTQEGEETVSLLEEQPVQPKSPVQPEPLPIFSEDQM
jgi:hypothetical protein